MKKITNIDGEALPAPNHYIPGHYYTLPDLLACMDRQQMANFHSGDESYIPSSITRHLRNSPQTTKLLARELSHIGFKRFQLFREGSTALILETVDNQLIRISNPQDDNAHRIYDPAITKTHSLNPRRGYGIDNSRIWHPLILQAIYTRDITATDGTSLRIEILPRMHRILGFKDEAKFLPLKQALEKSGIHIPDLHNNNVGAMLLPDGKELLLAIDVGLAEFYRPPERTIVGDHLKPWLTPDGRFLQCIAEPRLKQSPKRNGSISGVNAPGDLERYERIRRQHGIREPSSYAELIDEKLLYPQEAHELLGRAADPLPGLPESFRKRVSIHADKYDNRSAPAIK